MLLLLHCGPVAKLKKPKAKLKGQPLSAKLGNSETGSTGSLAS